MKKNQPIELRYLLDQEDTTRINQMIVFLQNAIFEIIEQKHFITPIRNAPYGPAQSDLIEEGAAIKYKRRMLNANTPNPANEQEAADDDVLF